MTNLTYFNTLTSKVEHSDIGVAMQHTMEDSDWHEELSVWIHTELVLDFVKFKIMEGSLNDKESAILFLAALFHDTGKPSKEVLHDDGKKSYRGHDLQSARILEEFAVCNWLLLEPYFTWEDIVCAMFLIERHQSYDVTNPHKVHELATAIYRWSHKLSKLHDTNVCVYNVFKALMECDRLGREATPECTDIMERKNKALFNALENIDFGSVVDWDKTKNSVFILVGASGSGKSTFIKSRMPLYHLSGAFPMKLSLDDLRVDFFHSVKGTSGYSKEIYHLAWELCCEKESEFTTFAKQTTRAAFAQAEKEHRDIYIDNTNLSRKRRAEFVELARKHKMNVFTVHFPITSEAIKARQSTRTSKSVPSDAVEGQYKNVTYAWLGVECDDLIVVNPYQDERFLR